MTGVKSVSALTFLLIFAAAFGQNVPRLEITEYALFMGTLEAWGAVDNTPFADSVRLANNLPLVVNDWSMFSESSRIIHKQKPSKDKRAYSPDSIVSTVIEHPRLVLEYEVTTSSGDWSIYRVSDSLHRYTDARSTPQYEIKLNGELAHTLDAFLLVCPGIKRVTGLEDHLIIEYYRSPNPTYPTGGTPLSDIWWGGYSLADSLGWEVASEFSVIGNTAFCVFQKDSSYGFWYNHQELPQKYDFIAPTTCQGEGTWDPSCNSAGFQAYAYRDGMWYLVLGRAVSKQ
ncbi:MAG: hypothetical protein IPP40_03860 [bacterium]|nr:hypothetical protein [bacterium]